VRVILCAVSSVGRATP